VRPLLVVALALLLVPAASAWPSATLTVTLWPKGKHGRSTTWTLRCDPSPRGSHPRPSAACRALARHPRALRPVSKGVACAELYSGPQVALVRGRFRGKRIRSWFKRTDSCETGRWNALSALLPVDD
jgi:hypothetical protein